MARKRVRVPTRGELWRLIRVYADRYADERSTPTAPFRDARRRAGASVNAVLEMLYAKRRTLVKSADSSSGEKA